MKSLQNFVCNFQHYFGGRSKRESSCLEIRSSARFLREIWISYFVRRILEGVFVGGIVNIRSECPFFSVHGKWIVVRNKQIAREPLCGLRDLFVPHCDSFPMNREYENQEWPRVPDRKISVEGDMLWHNPNRGVSRGLDVKACRPRLIFSDLEREVILDSFSRWILTIKCILLAFLLLFWRLTHLYAIHTRG